ncbi:MAG: hypothetical protein N2314_06985 [Brevinematales bacterium]|nr:hypothetical protein [Brevinematales bacterium]
MVFVGLCVVMGVARLRVKEFLFRAWKVVWITLPVLFFTLRTKQTGLFLGWFYLDPVIEYGVMVLRLGNFSLAFWMLQEFWYFPLGKGWNWWGVRVFWRAFGLVMDMWNDILVWPRQRFSLWTWVEKRYEEGKRWGDQVLSENIDNLYTPTKE